MQIGSEISYDKQVVGTFETIAARRVKKKVSAALCVAASSAGKQGCVKPYFSKHAFAVFSASGKGYARSLVVLNPQHSSYFELYQ